MRRLRPTRFRATALATAGVAVVLAAGGCGAAGEGAEPVAEPAPAISVPSDLTMGGDGGPGSGGKKEKEKDEAPEEDAAQVAACAEMQEAWATTNRALVDLSPEHPRALVQSFRSGHKAMTETEPTPEISSAWTSMADYLGSAVTAFEDVDEDDADDVSTAMADAISADDTARAATAAEDVTDYLAANCSGA